MRLADLAPVKLLLPAIPLVVVAIATPPSPVVESPPIVKVERRAEADPPAPPAPKPVPDQPAPAPQPQLVT
jgi:hypothetical protein